MIIGAKATPFRAYDEFAATKTMIKRTDELAWSLAVI